MIDIPFVFATIGYLVLLGSGIPQIYRNLKDKYTGNQRLSLYLFVGIGSVLLLPSTWVSGRLDLFFGTMGNATEMAILTATVLKYRHGKPPVT
jgi:hypothetical protein